jgi:hypothetical protein
MQSLRESVSGAEQDNKNKTPGGKDCSPPPETVY